MHKSSYKEMGKFIATLPDSQLRIADVGSFDVNGSYKPLITNKKWTYVGLDIEAGPNVDVVLSNGDNWSNVRDNSFDVVVSGQALEHTKHPWLFMAEIARILKPGGRTCVIAPHTWGFHRYPLDCWRILPDGMKALMEFCGLEVEDIRSNMEQLDRKRRGETIGVARLPK